MKLPVFASISFVLTVVSVADAHSWLTKPVSREREAQGDITDKIGCPNMTPGESTSFKAGETIDVRYWRNNHLGGFIRWSIVPKGQETKANLDKNAFYYTCRESGATCVPHGEANKTNIYADDNGYINSVSCGDKITLPDWLPAGDYVLQWTCFGIGGSIGGLGWADPQFRSCADIKLTTDGSKSAPPKCPTFVGGDRVTKIKKQSDDKCWYFYTNDIVDFWYTDGNADYASKYQFGVPAPVEKCSGSGSANSTAVPAPAAPPKTPMPAPTTPTPAVASKSPAPVATKSPAGCKVKRSSK